jgi:5-methylcytosine-specific restriction enzyme subunit McrC
MNQLYEKFVAEWLRIHLPNHLEIKTQHRLEYNTFTLKIDLIIYDKQTHKNSYVLDTKYKTEITQSDIYQIITYAIAQKCNNAIIITPNTSNFLTDKIENIYIRSLNFSLQGDIEEAGNNFLKQLL